ncbi:MAG: pyridoxamine 5'-phosphate oxidase [Pseudomonadota bacterium]|nr:pyridoxamine 5'-phosphate oxidase [Pseudomonadota bacterium]MDE3037767.1 pyridoxamine 5'-phosphate oxidase [Pseudomonadota bacterium]
MVDPITQFSHWLEEARRHNGIIEPTAACLATADLDGKPSARMVLVKSMGGDGFSFYTNLGSRKSRDLRQNPQASLCFYWMPLRKQVRIEGGIEPVSPAEADAYFATRPRDSRIGAWASRQSEPLSSPAALQQAVAARLAEFDGEDVPRPEFWSGWRVVPEAIEFWQQGEFRLHERELYTRKGQGWEMVRLYP